MKRTVYTINNFLDQTLKTWGNNIASHVRNVMHVGNESESQVKAWKDCFHDLQRELVLLDINESLKNEVYIIFEYELKRENGRRPDVILLSNNNVLILEFKGHGIEDQGQIDQAKHYARDIKNHHKESHELDVIPFLVLSSAKGYKKEQDGVKIISADLIATEIKQFITDKFNNIELWFNSPYETTPSLIDATKLNMETGKFPELEIAKSSGINATIEKIKSIAVEAKLNNEHHIVFVNGVPGAGKTLVGLKLAITHNLPGQKVSYLTGNGPAQIIESYFKREDC